MFRLYLGPKREDTRGDTKRVFRANFTPEWLESDLAKAMVLGVDKSKVLSPYCIESPVLGQIAPDVLSGGVKILLILLNTDIKMDLTRCGENCAEWLLKIGKIKDFEGDLDYYMPIDPKGQDIFIVNDKSIVNTKEDLINKMLDYIS